MIESDLNRILIGNGDARVWAEQFAIMAKRLYNVEMDEGWLIGWFANAIGTGEMIAEQKTPEFKAMMAKVLGEP